MNGCKGKGLFFFFFFSGKWDIFFRMAAIFFKKAMSHKPREEIFFRKEEMINTRSSEIKIKLEELEFIMKVF